MVHGLDDADEWTLLDNQTSITWTSRKETLYFPIDEPWVYKEYRLMVTSTAAQAEVTAVLHMFVR